MLGWLATNDLHAPGHVRSNPNMHSQRIRFRLALLVAGAMVLAWSSSASATAWPPSTPDQSRPRAMDGAPDQASRLSTQALQPFSTTKPPPLNRAAQAGSRLRREVFGFVNAGNLADPSVGYPTWNFDLLSTVAYFAIHVNSGNGNLVYYDTAWAIYHSATMSNFVYAAHVHGVRVIVSINLHDFSTDPNNQVCQGLIAANAQNTINQAVALVAYAGIDGINLNYEGTITTCANGLTNRDQLTAMIKNLRAAMAPGSYLAIDTFSGSAEDNLEFFDVTGLAPYVDSFFVMAYDMDFANAGDAPLLCGSYCFSPISPLNTYRFNVTKSMAQYMALVPAGKIILGQPYFGRRGCVPNLTDAHQYPIPGTNFVTPTYLFASTVPSQGGVLGFVAHRDPSDGVSEWDTWYDTDWQCLREQYFDDVKALGAKYDVVNADNLRGVGLFTLDYGGGASELWNELDLKFALPTPWYLLGGALNSGADAASWGASRTDVFLRGAENGLWQTTWNGTSWSWTFLGGVLNADPGAVSWGPNRVDVFARGIDNALWHRSSDGTSWAPWEKLGGVITSGPDASSSSPGHLDVFVRGTEGGLWQVSWNGTAWSWTFVGGLITSDPGVVSSGPNHIDVFVRGTEKGLWQASWNGTAWTWNFLGGVLSTGPDAASCAAGHLDVFALGTDHALWQRHFDGTSWGAWTWLRGEWTADPGVVCPTGTTAISMFERAADGAMWQTNIPTS